MGMTDNKDEMNNNLKNTTHMELSTKDKKLLFGGRCKLFTICARKKAKAKINELIAEADQLLVTYPAVDYNNFGVVVNTDALKDDLFAWSRRVNDFFNEVFKGKDSDVQMKFIYIVGRNSYGEYLILRDTLVNKRAYLVEFQEVLAAL